MDESWGLPVPVGHRVLIPGRGTTFVREVPGPPGAPTVVLVHGWMASAGINWFQAFEPLGRHFRVLAPDLRGHGRGIRSSRRFTLEDNADDIAELLGLLGVDEAILVGYSLGGPVSQLVWRRHRHRVAGLVFAATGADLVTGGPQRMVMRGSLDVIASGVRAGGVPRWMPTTLARQFMPATRGGTRAQTLEKWVRGEFSRHSWRMIAEAGAALGSYSSRDWIHEIDRPTASLVTLNDSAVTPAAQHGLAAAIGGARVHHFEGNHRACMDPDFGAALAPAVIETAVRAGLLAPGTTHLDLVATESTTSRVS